MKGKTDMTNAIYTITTKLNIDGDMFSILYAVFSDDNGNDLFHALNADEKALYWKAYDELDHYHELLNPRPIVVKKSRRGKKTA